MCAQLNDLKIVGNVMIDTLLENRAISTWVYIMCRDSTSLVTLVTSRPTGFVSKKRAERLCRCWKTSCRMEKITSCPIFSRNHWRSRLQAKLSSSTSV